MFGLMLTLIAALAIGFAAYRIGSTQCNPDAEKRDTDRNTALVVLALGFMFLFCGVLSAMSGSWNPLDGVLGKTVNSQTSVLL
jgi:hypothetical protein